MGVKGYVRRMIKIIRRLTRIMRRMTCVGREGQGGCKKGHGPGGHIHTCRTFYRKTQCIYRNSGLGKKHVTADRNGLWEAVTIYGLEGGGE